VLTRIDKIDSKALDLPNQKDKQTPLFSAIKYGKMEAIKYLVLGDENAIFNKDTIFEKNPAKVNLNARDQNGDTPLHLASKMGLRDIVEMLLQLGAEEDTENNQGQMAIDMVRS
jgi:ankyrin repeat protein